MSDCLGIQELSTRADKILTAHHYAMKHSVKTGRIEYNREDRAVPCHDDEMEHQSSCATGYIFASGDLLLQE